MSEENQTMDEMSKEIDDSFKNFHDEGEADWGKIKEYLENKTVFPVTVEEVVNKGVVTHVEGTRAFIPASHLALTHVDDLSTFVGKEIEVQVLEADDEKKRLLLSARNVLRAKADEERRKKIESIEIGSVFTGTVESLKPYGAFIDLGDHLSGLLHVSQISHKHVNDPSDVLKTGQEVKVKVIRIKDGKLSLSMRALEERPGRSGSEDRSAERMPSDYKLPKSENLTTNLGNLLKGLNLDNN